MLNHKIIVESKNLKFACLTLSIFAALQIPFTVSAEDKVNDESIEVIKVVAHLILPLYKMYLP